MSDELYVLDASALLATLRAEPGAEYVADRLDRACISAVNVSEVVSKLAERGVPAPEIAEVLAELDLDIRDFGPKQALRTGLLRPLTRALGLSLGDRACLALAAEIGGVALTAERLWLNNAVGVEVEVIR